MNVRGVELVQLQIDKRLDEHGEAELDARLQADPALVRYREELRDVVLALRSAPTPVVPAGFTEEVLRRAGLRRRPKVVPLPQRREWRVGFALAASVLLAVVVLRVVDQGPFDPKDQMVGALAPPFPTVAVEQLGDGLRLTFDVPPGPSGELIVEFPGSGQRIVLSNVTAGRTSMRVADETGEFTATLVRDGMQIPIARQE